MSDCGDVKKVFVKTEVKTEVKPVPKGIEILPKAAEKVKLFLANEGKSSDEYGLKVSVKKDGCSGFSYDMQLSDVASAEAAGDKIFREHGAILIVEKTSYFYVIGSHLDYVEALTGSGFNLVNPNVKKTCSCGSSFGV